MADKPIIAITMGDPCGIGPEVIAKALASGEVYPICRPVVVGNTRVMKQAVNLVKAPLGVKEVSSVPGVGQSAEVIEVLDMHNLDPRHVTVGKISSGAGKAAMEWATQAGKLCLAGEVQAMATAPVNKEAAALAGYKAIGHMELLQELSGAKEVATMLVSGNLRVVHLTTHRSLRRACDYVTQANVLAKIELTNRSFKEWGMAHPRIGVAALNPHASDGGLLGDEEEKQIAPAVGEARKKGIDASGPVPADIVFYQAIKGKYDVVLAMYHDQGHIPVKVYGFERSISVNLGLPFIRSSVDHGTAFDIAGKGVADATSMLEAIKVAVNLASGRGLE